MPNTAINDPTVLSAEATEAKARAIQRETSRQVLVGVGASYLGDAALIAAYCAMAHVSWWVLSAYLIVAVLHLGASSYALDRVATQGSTNDPTLARPQLIAASAVQLVFFWLAPKAFIVFACAAYSLVAFGSLRVSLRQMFLAWIGLTLGFVAVIVLTGERFSIPTDSVGARAILIIAWSLTLLRCIGIGSFGLKIREAAARRQQETENAARRFVNLAHRDELTGILNRRRILELASLAHTRLSQDGHPFSLALLDLDHFKHVNDAHGHPTGDAVLKAACARIASALRTGDDLGRYGGEEFLAVMQDQGDPRSALAAADRVRLAVAKHPWASIAPGLLQTISIGVVICRADESLEDAIARVDLALYACKREGRNTVRLG
jgi:diguanylate cyclase (GGDEF)-like protein